MSQAKPIALCLEQLQEQTAQTYLRCVALVGRQAGLRIDSQGQVLWRNERNVACELCVSLDQHLILLRPERAVRVRVARAGRSLDVPSEKPVVLLDGDEIHIGPRCYRVHVHGDAPAIAAPSPLVWRAPSVSKKVAAMVALGAAVAGCDERSPSRTDGTSTSIEVREEPPSIAEVDDGDLDGSAKPDGGVKPDGSAKPPVTADASAPNMPSRGKPAKPKLK